MFLITSGMLLSSGVIYLMFADSELQSWNNPTDDGTKEEKEVLPVEREMITIVSSNTNHNHSTVETSDNKMNGTKR